MIRHMIASLTGKSLKDYSRTQEQEEPPVETDVVPEPPQLRENQWVIRHMAIENAELAGLCRLRPDAKRRLILEGLQNVQVDDQLDPEQLTHERLQASLEDQEHAVHTMWTHAVTDRKLTVETLKQWHTCATRRQIGRWVSVKKHNHKGWGVKGTKPYDAQGHLRTAWERGISLNPHDMYLVFGEKGGKRLAHATYWLCRNTSREVVRKHVPSPAVAAWAQLEFIRLRPFTDGNSRVSRLLGAWIYVRRGHCPPVIRARTRKVYHRRCYMSHEYPQGNQKKLAALLERAAVSAMRLDRHLAGSR